jgi:hypothetical protein
MTFGIDVSITGLDRLERKYSRSKINSASHVGLEAALFQVETEAKDAATQIIYASPENRPTGAAATGAIRKSKPGARRAVAAIAKSAGKRTGAYRASLGRGGPSNVRRIGADSAAFGSRLDYAKIIEEGSKAHTIRPLKKNALAFWGGSEMVIRKVIHHPGTKPRHVLRTAATNGKQRIADAYARAFWRNLG